MHFVDCSSDVPQLYACKRQGEHKAVHVLRLNIPPTNLVRDLGVMHLKEFYLFNLQRHPYTGSWSDLMLFPQKGGLGCKGLSGLICHRNPIFLQRILVS